MLDAMWSDIMWVGLGLWAIHCAVVGELRTYRRAGGYIGFYKLNHFAIRFGIGIVGGAIIWFAVSNIAGKLR
jgi:hypothetical protein